jgi:hypothetical protein
MNKKEHPQQHRLAIKLKILTKFAGGERKSPCMFSLCSSSLSPPSKTSGITVIPFIRYYRNKRIH